MTNLGRRPLLFRSWNDGESRVLEGCVCLCCLRSEMSDCVAFACQVIRLTKRVRMKTVVAVGTDLCWTEPHQNPHSGPLDRTGSAWSHPRPPPPTGRPLWSTRTPPPPACRHLSETSAATSYFCGPSAVTRSLAGLFFPLFIPRERRESQEGKTKRGLLLASPGFVLPHLVLSHLLASCLISPLSCKFCLSRLICSPSTLSF